MVRWLLYLMTLAAAVPAYAQAPASAPRSAFIEWGVFIAVFFILWFILYSGAYRLFLRYFSPRYCKFLFWSLFSLYALTWLDVSAYIWWDWGFRYLWLRWVAVMMAVLWLAWYLIAMLRSDPLRGR